MQLFALQPAVDDRRQLGVLHRGGKASLDHVEGLDRTDVIVLPVRFDESFRQPVELGGVERQRFGFMAAGECRRRG
jgi:hypothetical protein